MEIESGKLQLLPKLQKNTSLEFNHVTLGMMYNNMYLAIKDKIPPSQVPTLLIIILKDCLLCKIQCLFFFPLQLKRDRNFIK